MKKSRDSAIFTYKEWDEADTCRLVYYDCVLKIPVGEHPPGKAIGTITVDYFDGRLILHVDGDEQHYELKQCAGERKRDKIINLTPHAIHLYQSATDTHPALTLFPAGGQPAVAEKITPCDSLMVDDTVVLISARVLGRVTDLPDPQPGAYYIVSTDVADACRYRDDLVVPGAPLRDADGRIRGYVGLYRRL